MTSSTMHMHCTVSSKALNERKGSTEERQNQYRPILPEQQHTCACMYVLELHCVYLYILAAQVYHLH